MAPPCAETEFDGRSVNNGDLRRDSEERALPSGDRADSVVGVWLWRVLALSLFEC
jgi:hypothetical protein